MGLFLIPVAAGKLIEIHAGIDRFIDVRNVELRRRTLRRRIGSLRRRLIRRRSYLARVCLRFSLFRLFGGLIIRLLWGGRGLSENTKRKQHDTAKAQGFIQHASGSCEGAETATA